jgi:Bacterial extracellular solute-binding proteins, family 3
MHELRAVTRIAPPIVRMEQGELSGFAVDLWNSIAQRLRARTRYQVAPDVGALLERVRSGKADLGVGAISITSAREREFGGRPQAASASRPILLAPWSCVAEWRRSHWPGGPRSPTADALDPALGGAEALRCEAFTDAPDPSVEWQIFR